MLRPMKPRADFACLTCLERWNDLPATYEGTCPDVTCRGEVARIWDSTGSPGVNRGAPAITYVDTVGLNEHEKAKIVDAYVQPQWEKAQAIKATQADPMKRTSLVTPGAALGMIDGNGRAHSRMLNAPLINNFPFPAPHVSPGHGGAITTRPPTSKPSHLPRD